MASFLNWIDSCNLFSCKRKRELSIISLESQIQMDIPFCEKTSRKFQQYKVRRLYNLSRIRALQINKNVNRRSSCPVPRNSRTEGHYDHNFFAELKRMSQESDENNNKRNARKSRRVTICLTY